MKNLVPRYARFYRTTRHSALAGSLLACIFGMQTASATVFTWANTNVWGATPTPTLDWFTGGANPKGTWSTTPVANSTYTTINLFQDTTTSLENTDPNGNAQTLYLNWGGVPFLLKSVLLNGKASDTTGANLVTTLAGDPLHFGTGGAIDVRGVNNEQTLSYNVSNPIIIGTTVKTLALQGSGSAELIVSGSLSEQTAGGGKVVKQGVNTVTLTGDSAISGGLDVLGGTIVLAGQNISGTNKLDLRRGNVVFDLSAGDERWGGGAAIPAPSFNGGTLTVKGAPSGASSQALDGPIVKYVQSKIVIDPNGGASTTVTLGNTWFTQSNDWGAFFVDRSAEGAVVLSNPTLANGLIIFRSKRAGVIVKDSTGIGFATVVGGEVVRYTDATQLQTNSTSGSTNFKTSGNIDLTAIDHSIGTLELDASTGDGILDLGTGSIGGTILMTGDHDYTIRNGSVVSYRQYLHHFGTGTLTIDAIVTRGMVKTGPGRVILTGTNVLGFGVTDWPAATLTICDGVAQAIDSVGVPTNVAIRLIGGVFQSSGNLIDRFVDASPSATSTNKVSWRPTLNGDSGRGGGFAAQGGTFTINLNAGAALAWGVGGFVQNDQTLILGSTSADSLLDWQNEIKLDNAYGVTGYPNDLTRMREIQVDDNPNSTTDIAQISGALTGIGGGLLKTGDGTLRLTAVNTYNGPTYINGGTLLINGSLSNSVEQVMVNAGATLGGSGIINRSVDVYADATLNGSLGLTCGTNVTIKSGAKIAWDSKATGKVTVNGTLTLPTTASVTFGSIPAGQLVLFESPNAIVGSVAGWTVTPSTINIRVSGNGKQVFASSGGTLFMVR